MCPCVSCLFYVWDYLWVHCRLSLSAAPYSESPISCSCVTSGVPESGQRSGLLSQAGLSQLPFLQLSTHPARSRGAFTVTHSKQPVSPLPTRVPWYQPEQGPGHHTSFFFPLLLSMKLSIEQINTASAYPPLVQITPHHPRLDLEILPSPTDPTTQRFWDRGGHDAPGQDLFPCMLPCMLPCNPYLIVLSRAHRCLCVQCALQDLLLFPAWRAPRISWARPRLSCCRQFTVRSKQFAFNCTPFASLWRTLSPLRVIQPQKGRTGAPRSPRHHKQDTQMEVS